MHPTCFGNRIQKAVDSDGDSNVDETTRFSYDGWQPGGGFTGNENWDIWADLDGSSSLTTRYLQGDVVDQLFARIDSSGDTYWLLGDHLGSIREVTDESGTVLDTIVYDGYGNISSEMNSTYRGRYAWTSREIDVETGLQYNRARYYDATIGKWISQDPFGFDAGDSNLYRYTNNRPTTEVDPSGQLTITALAPGFRLPSGQRGGENYKFRIKWNFKLSNPAPEDGYIVQKIEVFESAFTKVSKPIGPQPKNPVYYYYEAWHVTKGKTVPDTQLPVKNNKTGILIPGLSFTDQGEFTPPNGYCGSILFQGSVKFFGKTTHKTGDLTKKGWKTNQVYSATFAGIQTSETATSPGLIISTGKTPEWWDKKPLEGPEVRKLFARWDLTDKTVVSFSGYGFPDFQKK